MLISEIIQRIQSLYSKGVQSDDSRLTARHIYNKVLTVRSRLIAQESKKNQKVSQWNYQTLPCVELIEADIHECPCLPPIECQIYRTKEKLPRPLSNYNRHLIESVTSVNGDIIFSEITWIEKKYKADNKFTATSPDYYIRNEYLYITQARNLPRLISVTGVWEDPLEAESFPSFCNQAVEIDCESPLDKELPIDKDMIDTLVEMVANELVILFSQNQEDLTNNTRDSIIEQSK